MQMPLLFKRETAAGGCALAGESGKLDSLSWRIRCFKKFQNIRSSCIPLFLP